MGRRTVAAVKQDFRQKKDVETISQQQSVTLVKNLVRTAISSIAYMRNLFSEDCFKEKNLTGLKVHSLLPINWESRLVIEWVEYGIFEALDLQYLSEIVFGIYEPSSSKNSSDKLLEAYNFRISYPELQKTTSMTEVSLSRTSTKNVNIGKVAISSNSSKNEIKNSTISMIRTLVTLVATLAPLPTSRFFTIQLSYRECTPDEYQPKYFRPAFVEEVMKFSSKPHKFHIGHIKTPYHEFVAKVKAGPQSFDENFSSMELESLTPTESYLVSEVQVEEKEFPDESSTCQTAPTLSLKESQSSELKTQTKPFPSKRNNIVNKEVLEVAYNERKLNDVSQKKKRKAETKRVVKKNVEAKEKSFQEDSDNQTVDDGFEERYFELVKRAIMKSKKPTRKFISEAFPELSRKLVSSILHKLAETEIIVKKGNMYFMNKTYGELKPTPNIQVDQVIEKEEKKIIAKEKIQVSDSKSKKKSLRSRTEKENEYAAFKLYFLEHEDEPEDFFVNSLCLSEDKVLSFIKRLHNERIEPEEKPTLLKKRKAKKDSSKIPPEFQKIEDFQLTQESTNSQKRQKISIVEKPIIQKFAPDWN